MLSKLAAVILLMLPPGEFCERFLLDANYLVNELGRIRQLALTVPVHADTYGPTNSVVDAVWNLEERIRFLMRLDAEKKRKASDRRRRKNKTEEPPPPEPKRAQWKPKPFQIEL